jgi:hypothetical protein
MEPIMNGTTTCLETHPENPSFSWFSNPQQMIYSLLPQGTCAYKKNVTMQKIESVISRATKAINEFNSTIEFADKKSAQRLELALEAVCSRLLQFRIRDEKRTYENCLTEKMKEYNEILASIRQMKHNAIFKPMGFKPVVEKKEHTIASYFSFPVAYAAKITHSVHELLFDARRRGLAAEMQVLCELQNEPEFALAQKHYIEQVAHGGKFVDVFAFAVLRLSNSTMDKSINDFLRLMKPYFSGSSKPVALFDMLEKLRDRDLSAFVTDLFDKKIEEIKSQGTVSEAFSNVVVGTLYLFSNTPNQAMEYFVAAADIDARYQGLAEIVKYLTIYKQVYVWDQSQKEQFLQVLSQAIDTNDPDIEWTEQVNKNMAVLLYLALCGAKALSRDSTITNVAANVLGILSDSFGPKIAGEKALFVFPEEFEIPAGIIETFVLALMLLYRCHYERRR